MVTISICWKNKFEKVLGCERIRKISISRIDKHFFQCYL